MRIDMVNLFWVEGSVLYDVYETPFLPEPVVDVWAVPHLNGRCFRITIGKDTSMVRYRTAFIDDAFAVASRGREVAEAIRNEYRIAVFERGWLRPYRDL